MCVFFFAAAVSADSCAWRGGWVGCVPQNGFPVSICLCIGVFPLLIPARSSVVREGKTREGDWTERTQYFAVRPFYYLVLFTFAYCPSILCSRRAMQRFPRGKWRTPNRA